ncbi:hypothetical protein [Sporosarcina jiandibaonis]|uniref:hypothetical protein n=1 Tax=Sporosarcina jiandibaonis TaxID=2715535 RepID=UPI0015578660|nr:hypothetical protein [Sporosarcina jiandibaonis]
MGFSEFVVLLLVYSGLLIFFLVPFSKQEQSKDYRGKISFSSVFKENLVKMICHKKAIFALVLLGLALISIQAGFEGAERHYNAHSGYSPVSNKLRALYSMGSVVIYTVVLLLSLGYMKTLKSMKGAK